MLKVVVVGYGEMFTNLIAAALDANCKIVGVLRNDTIKYPPIVRKLRDLVNPSVEYNYIKSYNLPEIETRSVNSDDFRKTLIKLNPDIVLVGSWGEKFEKATYSIPKTATINAHPSLLPKYRGPNPYFWVIKNQESTTGVTFHLMDEGFDTGAILAQEEVKIFPTDTGRSLKDRLVLTARGVACALLRDLNEDIIIPLQQREDRASYYSYPKGFELDFKKSAEENSALIRACYPWNEAYFYHDMTPLVAKPENVCIKENYSEYKESSTIVKVDSNSKIIGVLCGDGKVLEMEVSLYKKWDRPFTKNFLILDVKVGDVI